MQALLELPRTIALPGTLRRNGLVLGLIAVHSAAAAAVAYALNVRFGSGLFDAMSLLLTIMLPLFAVLAFARMIVRIACHPNGVRPFRRIANGIAGSLFDPRLMLDAAVTLAAFSLFCANFGFLKCSLPMMNDFSWDPAFARLDRLLWGGHDAYRVLLPFMTPRLVSALSYAYVIWFPLMFMMVFSAMFTRADDRGRNVFLATFIMVWAIGGNLLATIFASAGPVYYQLLGHGPEFAPLVHTLDRFNELSPNLSLPMQAKLWAGYAHEGPSLGISAMPSMHVACATVLTLHARQRARWAGLAMMLFTATIFVASIVLGWHYSIDGIFGALLAIALWQVAGRLIPETSSTEAGHPKARAPKALIPQTPEPETLRPEPLVAETVCETARRAASAA